MPSFVQMRTQTIKIKKKASPERSDTKYKPPCIRRKEKRTVTKHTPPRAFFFYSTFQKPVTFVHVARSPEIQISTSRVCEQIYGAPGVWQLLTLTYFIRGHLSQELFNVFLRPFQEVLSDWEALNHKPLETATINSLK